MKTKQSKCVWQELDYYQHIRQGLYGLEGNKFEKVQSFQYLDNRSKQSKEQVRRD